MDRLLQAKILSHTHAQMCSLLYSSDISMGPFLARDFTGHNFLRNAFRPVTEKWRTDEVKARVTSSGVNVKTSVCWPYHCPLCSGMCVRQWRWYLVGCWHPPGCPVLLHPCRQTLTCRGIKDALKKNWHFHLTFWHDYLCFICSTYKSLIASSRYGQGTMHNFHTQVLKYSL